MAVLATDNFVRANENPITAPWAGDSVDQDLQLLNDGVTTIINADSSVASYSGITWADDQWSEVTATASDATKTALAGVVVRASTSASTFYLFYVTLPASGGSVSWGLNKLVSGTNTSIATGTTPFAVGQTIRLSVQGTTIKAYANGTLVATKTDSSIAAGNPGLYDYTTFNWTVSTALGNWIGGDFSGPDPSSISPSSGTQGDTLNVTVTGTDFDLNAGGTLSFSGTGITVNSYSVQDATTITANITVASNAPLGAQDVIVTNASDGQTGTLSGAFMVTAAAPSVYSVPDCRLNPNTGVTVNGTIQYTGQTSCNPGVAGIVDCRVNKPADCRKAGAPQNCRKQD
jgi:hypothetical protein